MPLSHEHVGPEILAKIKIYNLTRAELLCSLCYEIPCNAQLLLQAMPSMGQHKFMYILSD
jgi:hypothetical protein